MVHRCPVPVFRESLTCTVSISKFLFSFCPSLLNIQVPRRVSAIELCVGQQDSPLPSSVHVLAQFDKGLKKIYRRVTRPCNKATGGDIACEPGIYRVGVLYLLIHEVNGSKYV